MGLDYKQYLYPVGDIDQEAMIEFQHDKKEIEEVLSILTVIKRDVENMVPGSHPSIGNNMDKISKILSKMVGYTISLTYAEGAGPATYVIPAKVNSSTYEEAEELANIYETIEDNGSRNTSYFKRWEDYEGLLAKSYKTLNDTLKMEGVTIDLEKAKVSGLDSGFTQIIMGDFTVLYTKYNLTPREVLSVILHEVGHVFTYLMFLDSKYAVMTTLLDTIKEEYLDKSNSREQTIRMVYHKVSGKDSKGKSNNEMVCEIAGKLIQPSITVGGKDVESLSDVFSARFGFGADLSTGLIKLYGGVVQDKSIVGNLFALALSSAIIVLGIALVCLASLTGSGYIVYVAVTFISWMWNSKVSTTSWFSSIDNGSSRYVRKLDTYDSLYDRVNRNKLQLIASLKNSNLSNASIKRIIEEVDTLTKLLKKLKGKNKGLMTKIASVFGNKKINHLDMHYLLEELMSSDLVTASNRLKTV